MSKINSNLHKGDSSVSTERLAAGTGALAAKQDNLSLLKRAVLANLLWEDNFYIDGQKVSDEISRLIPLCPAKDVANLAVEARKMQKLRHVPLFICVEMLKYKTHSGYVKSILPQIITRADMITDFLAIYKKVNGKIKPLAKSAKIGLAECFNNFNEYQFAKYDRNSEIKLRDVMFLVHPTPKNNNEELFRKIANRTLETPDTWEVALSTGKDKKATWERLISEKKLGGLAMLRNLRNMRNVDVNHNIIKQGLKNLNNSMLLPFNYLMAWRENSELEKDIEDAMINSYKNLPRLIGKTLFIVDVSGSMDAKLSGKSNLSRLDAACAMALLAVNQCEEYEIVITAGSDSSRIGKHELIKYPSKGFDLFRQLTADRLGGGGIFTRQCLEWCKENTGTDFDRIIIFSDSQDCDHPDKRIPKPFGKYNYICDVSSELRGINYKGRWTAEISGNSENFLTYIASFEGNNNMFDNIE